MKKKKLLFQVLLILGLCLVAASFIMRNTWFSGRTGGTVMGIAGALTSVSISQLLALWQEEENPKIRKQNEIDRNDERNRVIRNQAKALSGDVLQWMIIAAGWLAFFLDAPAWILLLAAGVFIVKSVLDLSLMAYYQGKM